MRYSTAILLVASLASFAVQAAPAADVGTLALRSTEVADIEAAPIEAREAYAEPLDDLEVRDEA